MTLNPFGPVYFRSEHSEDFIPAIPDPSKQPPDPTWRDRVALVPGRPHEWAWAKPRWSFNVTTGDLESRYYMDEVDAKEINDMVDEARRNYGDAVTRIVLFLSPQAAESHFHELRIHGFDRCETKEGKIPQLVFVGPAKKWN